MIDINASTYSQKRTIYRVECEKGIECPGMPGTRGYDTEREAAAAWNTRAAEEEPDTELDASPANPAETEVDDADSN